MKSYLKLIWGLVGLIALVNVPVLLADEVITTYPISGASYSRAPLDYSRSASIAGSESNGVMVALNAQALLLKEILQEHQSRAAEFAQKGEGEKAKWETELVNELREKSGRLQKSIEQMSQPGAATKDSKGVGREIDDELIFVSAVEARLEQIRQELSAVTEDTRLLSLQISTNKVPEEIAAKSAALGDNQRWVKEFQREQLDLELRKLEFRAIRRATRK